MEAPSVSPEAGEETTVDVGTSARPVTLRVTGWSLVRGVLLVAAGLLALGVALAASTVLWWLAIATAVAAAGYPAVTWLRRWLPAWAAIMVVILAVVAFVGLVGYQGVAELKAQFEILRANALEAARSLQSSTKYGQVAGEFGLVDKTTHAFEGLPVVLGGGGGQETAATVQSAASSGSALFAVATFAVLLLIFGPRFVQAGLMQIDDYSVRSRIGALVIGSYHASARYVWLMAARAVVIGVLGGLLCMALGREAPTAVGVAFAALSLIPGLGIVLATLPFGLYLAAVDSVPTGVAVIGGAVAVQAVEAGLVQARINRASVHVGPTATLVGVLLGQQLYGLGGVLVGLAVAVYGLAVLRRLTESHDELLTAVRQLVREGGTGVEVAVEPEDGAAPDDGDGDDAGDGGGSGSGAP